MACAAVGATATAGVGATSWLTKATIRQAKKTAELIRMSRKAEP
jgi:hypothetical protein